MEGPMKSPGSAPDRIGVKLNRLGSLHREFPHTSRKQFHTYGGIFKCMTVITTTEPLTYEFMMQ